MQDCTLHKTWTPDFQVHLKGVYINSCISWAFRMKSTHFWWMLHKWWKCQAPVGWNWLSFIGGGLHAVFIVRCMTCGALMTRLRYSTLKLWSPVFQKHLKGAYINRHIMSIWLTSHEFCINDANVKHQLVETVFYWGRTACSFKSES